MDSEGPIDKEKKPEGTDGPANQDGTLSVPQMPQTATEIDPSPSPPCDEQACNKNRDWLDYATFGAQIIGIVGLFVYTTVAALQWRTMSKTFSEIQKQTPSIIKAAGEATRANDDARDRFKQDQRPYIWLTNENGSPKYTPPDPKIGEVGRITWDLKYTNYGRSPAYVLTIDEGMEFGENAKDKPRIYSRIIGGGEPSPPNRIDLITAYVLKGPDAIREVSQVDFDRFMNIDHGIIAYGRIAYTDAFGGQYETSFCLEHLRNGHTAYCTQGNHTEQYAQQRRNIQR
jgi:hypothetical protein